MVKYFTQFENALQERTPKTQKVMKNVDIESELAVRLREILMQPSDRCIENILRYSKQFGRKKA